MKELTLKRINGEGNEHGTFGVLLDGKIPFAVTLEPPWKDNQVNVSCILDGEFACRRVMSPKYGSTFEVADVFGRSHILFHWGNTERNTQGCILVGEEYGELSGKPSILSSKRGFNEFLQRLGGSDEFKLTIVVE